MAQSTICCAMFGATTLIIAISCRAALLPTVSIMCAAFSVSRRACSIMMRDCGDALERDGLLRQRLAEGDALLRAAAHPFQHALAETDQAHAMMDASGAKPPLRDFEAAAFAEQHVADGHADVVENDLRGAVGHAVEAEHRQRADDAHAGRILRHQDHRLPPVAVGIVRVGLCP